MLKHIVMFKLKDPTPDALAEAKARIEALYGQIPELLRIEVGVNIVESPRDYHFVLVSEFETLDALRRYQTHPAHVEMLAWLNPRLDAAAAVDYELTD
jgi:hypothetical protein